MNDKARFRRASIRRIPLNEIRRSHLLGAIVTLAAALLTVQAQSPLDPTTQTARILQDYIYGFSPVAMEATRAILTAVQDTSRGGGFWRE